MIMAINLSVSIHVKMIKPLTYFLSFKVISYFVNINWYVHNGIVEDTIASLWDLHLLFDIDENDQK